MSTTILDCIGNTPLLRLNTSAACYKAQVYVKVESHNPGGSVKDRIAKYMIHKALERGTLTTNGTIVEPTSGNTGIGLAMICASLGISCILTMPESMSIERRKLLAAFGAELVLTPAKLGMAGALDEADSIASKISGAVILGQFTNPDVVDAHYTTTGPEIFKQMNATLDVLVAGVGTGGTLSGAGLFLKEKIPHLEVVAVEPALSPLLSGGKPGPHPIQGIGPNFIPKILRTDIIDKIIQVDADEAIKTSRLLFTSEGINCGISSGANVWAALELAKQSNMEGKKIVTFICDTGERYLSTALFN